MNYLGQDLSAALAQPALPCPYWVDMQGVAVYSSLAASLKKPLAVGAAKIWIRDEVDLFFQT